SPVRIGYFEDAADASCRCTLARFGGFPDQDGIQIRIMAISLGLVVGPPSHGVAEADDVLQQQRDCIALGVRQNGPDHLSSETVISGWGQKRPRIMIVTIAFGGRGLGAPGRIVWLDDFLVVTI